MLFNFFISNKHTRTYNYDTHFEEIETYIHCHVFVQNCREKLFVLGHPIEI